MLMETPLGYINVQFPVSQIQSLACGRDINPSGLCRPDSAALYDGTDVTVRVIRVPAIYLIPESWDPPRHFPAPGRLLPTLCKFPMQSIRHTYGAALRPPWEFDERATTKLLKIMYGARRLPPAKKLSTYQHIGDTFTIFDLVGHTLTRVTKFWL